MKTATLRNTPSYCSNIKKQDESDHRLDTERQNVTTPKSGHSGPRLISDVAYRENKSEASSASKVPKNETLVLQIVRIIFKMMGNLSIPSQREIDRTIRHQHAEATDESENSTKLVRTS